MTLAFQLWALDEGELDAVLSTPGGAETYFTERFVVDQPGEAVWIDKAGMGILEALGVMSGEEPTGPAAWVLGRDMFPGDELPTLYVPADTVQVIADFLRGISDEQFARLAANNELDGHAGAEYVEYLTHHFGKLRDSTARPRSDMPPYSFLRPGELIATSELPGPTVRPHSPGHWRVVCAEGLLVSWCGQRRRSS